MNLLDEIDRADLMCGDTVAAHIQSRAVIPVEPNLVPLCFRHGGDIEGWLEHRAIDAHRTHSRLLKKVLRLRKRDDLSTALHFNAATITDNYWVRPEGSDLVWENVRFRDNDFADLALKGTLADFSKKPSRTPELTNTGSFEKCWRLESGEWWMCKAENELERFSELFVFELCRALGFPTAEYQNSGAFIRTKDFTRGVLNFEPAAYLVGDDEDYVANYEAFQEFGERIADQYVELLLMDAFCRNADRHTYNYGLLRDQKTGQVLSMAPNFDHNIALVARGYDDSPRKSDLLMELLVELEGQTHAVSRYLSRHPKPIITPELIVQCCIQTGMTVDVDYIQQFVMAGYKVLDEIC